MVLNSNERYQSSVKDSQDDSCPKQLDPGAYASFGEYKTALESLREKEIPENDLRKKLDEISQKYKLQILPAPDLRTEEDFIEVLKDIPLLDDYFSNLEISEVNWFQGKEVFITNRKDLSRQFPTGIVDGVDTDYALLCVKSLDEYFGGYYDAQSQTADRLNSDCYQKTIDLENQYGFEISSDKRNSKDHLDALLKLEGVLKKLPQKQQVCLKGKTLSYNHLRFVDAEINLKERSFILKGVPTIISVSVYLLPEELLTALDQSTKRLSSPDYYDFSAEIEKEQTRLKDKFGLKALELKFADDNDKNLLEQLPQIEKDLSSLGAIPLARRQNLSVIIAEKLFISDVFVDPKINGNANPWFWFGWNEKEQPLLEQVQKGIKSFDAYVERPKFSTDTEINNNKNRELIRGIGQKFNLVELKAYASDKVVGANEYTKHFEFLEQKIEDIQSQPYGKEILSKLCLSLTKDDKSTYQDKDVYWVHVPFFDISEDSLSEVGDVLDEAITKIQGFIEAPETNKYVLFQSEISDLKQKYGFSFVDSYIGSHPKYLDEQYQFLTEILKPVLARLELESLITEETFRGAQLQLNKDMPTVRVTPHGSYTFSLNLGFSSTDEATYQAIVDSYYDLELFNKIGVLSDYWQIIKYREIYKTHDVDITDKGVNKSDLYYFLPKLESAFNLLDQKTKDLLNKYGVTITDNRKDYLLESEHDDVSGEWFERPIVNLNPDITATPAGIAQDIIEKLKSIHVAGLLTENYNGDLAALKVDPTIDLLPAVIELWKQVILPKETVLSAKDTRDFQRAIAYNIFFEGSDNDKIITKEKMQKHVDNIFEGRESIKTVPAMKGYFVIFAHNEQLDAGEDAEAITKSGDQNRFGKQGLIEKAKEFNNGKEPIVARSKDNSPKALLVAKQAALKAFDSPEPGLRLVLDQHGSGPYLFFGDMDEDTYSFEEIVEASAISAEEMAEAMFQRYKKYPKLLKDIKKDKNKRDVIFGIACKGNNFAQEFQMQFLIKTMTYNVDLARNGSPYEDLIIFDPGEGPVFIPAAEFGQSAWSDLDSPYGNSFWEDLMQLDNPEEWNGDTPTMELFLKNGLFEINGSQPQMLGYNVSQSVSKTQTG
jgi:hypothetical protein